MKNCGMILSAGDIDNVATTIAMFSVRVKLLELKEQARSEVCLECFKPSLADEIIKLEKWWKATVEDSPGGAEAFYDLVDECLTQVNFDG